MLETLDTVIHRLVVPNSLRDGQSGNFASHDSLLIVTIILLLCGMYKWLKPPTFITLVD